MTATGAKKAKLKQLMTAFDSGPQDWAPLLYGNVSPIAKLALKHGLGDSVKNKAKIAVKQFMHQEKHEDDRITEASLALCGIEDRTVDAYLDKYGPEVEEVRKKGYGVVNEEAGPALMPDFLKANHTEIEALAQIQDGLADADYLISLLDPNQI